MVDETPSCKSIVLDAPEWRGHQAGQHVDVRLTAEDGYQAQRSYSIASGPEDAELMLTVERLDDGEVSPYLVDELRPGDVLELRGPIGGYFVWDGTVREPVVMIAGGSGVVPFRAMLRHRQASRSASPATLVYSARAPEDIIYRGELDELAAADGITVELALTRRWPEDWPGYRGRIDNDLLEALVPRQRQPLVYICGPTGFVESAAQLLVDAGHDAARIKTERFGPTGR
jgi:ferredoxin-NADP reductase